MKNRQNLCIPEFVLEENYDTLSYLDYSINWFEIFQSKRDSVQEFFHVSFNSTMKKFLTSLWAFKFIVSCVFWLLLTYVPWH